MYENSNVGGYYDSGPTLSVFNIPATFDERELRRHFPSAKSITCQPYGSFLLQFNTDSDCQAVYNECLNGKDVGGQQVQAQMSQGTPNMPTGYNDSRYPSYGQEESGNTTYGRGGGDNNGNNQTGCVLTVHNLCWTITNNDLIDEFPRAIGASVKLDDQGRSRGWGTVTFANANDCKAAENEGSGKMIRGRQIRVEIQNGEDNYRRGGGGRQYDNRSHDRGGSDRGGRRYDDGGRRGYRGGGGGYGGGGRRGNDSRGGRDSFRRERSRSPDRSGRRGGGGGARITSAVIRRVAGDSSDSDFDSR